MGGKVFGDRPRVIHMALHADLDGIEPLERCSRAMTHPKEGRTRLALDSRDSRRLNAVLAAVSRPRDARPA